jgi:hypothetical protein
MIGTRLKEGGSARVASYVGDEAIRSYVIARIGNITTLIK